MSNIVPLNFDSGVPAFAKGSSAITESLNSSLSAGVKRLSIKGGTFRYIVGGQEVAKIDDRHLDVVLVNAAPHVNRLWYAGQYVEGASSGPPQCWSMDGRVPDPSAAQPQGENCMNCPQNQKGSGQGETKACRYSQRMAVVLANDIGGEVLQLSLPATSIFGDIVASGAPLQAYYKALRARSVDPTALITRMKFDTDAATPKIVFAAMGWLTQDQYNKAVEQGKSDAAIKAITMTVFDGDREAVEMTLPPGTPPVLVAAPKAAKMVVATGETTMYAQASAQPAATAEEPVVRKTDAASSSISNKLEKLVKEWADDE